MNFVEKDGTTKVYIPVHPWATEQRKALDRINLFIRIYLGSSKPYFGRAIQQIKEVICEANICKGDGRLSKFQQKSLSLLQF